MSRIKNIRGNVYGDLTAVSIADKSANGDYFWNCSCSCGNLFKTTVGRLGFGRATSCGCKTFEKQSKAKSTHGMSKGGEYKSWVKMRERCLCVTDKEYPNYGAVGIVIEEEWKTSFEAFYAHIGPKPKDRQRYSVDRIDNDGSYVAGNVRWATDSQQARNKGMQCNNTSGKMGVSWDDKAHPNGITSTLYAKAGWRSLTGGTKSKYFSTKSFGILPAFAMAVRYRDKMIAQLNSVGAGYSDKHGK